MSYADEVEELYQALVAGSLQEKTMGYGYFGGYHVDDDNDKPLECNWHNYEEKLLFGVHTFWECRRCKKTIKFEEIDRYDNIVGKRLSSHPLPWEKGQ